MKKNAYGFLLLGLCVVLLAAIASDQMVNPRVRVIASTLEADLIQDLETGVVQWVLRG